MSFDDSRWEVVSLPHGIEYLPTEASGCINYQGEVWYRKHFSPEKGLKGKKLFLHFEAIMGKSRIYLNGKLVKEHFGGYLPVVIDITNAIRWDAENLLSVWADNSNDPNYPPGKSQDVLDYTYMGGIYRDCWLVAHNNVYITDPNYEDITAGGGFFVFYNHVSEQEADVSLQLHLRNEWKKSFQGVVEYELQQADGKQTALINHTFTLKSNHATTIKEEVTLKNPHLWSPENPYLYHLFIRVLDKEGNIIDGYRQRIGIRSVEFKGAEGFWLNGKPYGKPLIGANRHQDFAVIGNAVPNSLHWKDAKKLRDAGLKIIRNAHCPQDPAFMDACDELGLFVIDNIPGWQFWNNDPIFSQRVYNDIRQVVRRDRNHPCIWLWEPILNETNYPADFAEKAQNTVKEEYPHPYCYSACDDFAQGHELFPVLFSHPSNANKELALKESDPKVSYFTREWGDAVDTWSAHNSPSRAAHNWGEHAMLVQARHYARPDYPYTSYDALCHTSPQHTGGCLWHPFDHQRGYHPDPFYGGIMDVFRQPKYSYYMFQAQRSPITENQPFETGPMVYIAHEMTPFSPKDVTVYSNCEEVKLTFNKNGKTYTYKKTPRKEGIPSPIITFKDAYDFMTDQHLSLYEGKSDDVYLLAEGIMGGKVVAQHKVCPARRPEKIILWADSEGMKLLADGSDAVVVTAAIADKNGNIKRLNNYHIKFKVEGEGRILGGASVLANPVPVKWGTAPILIQSTLKPGKIKVTASVLFEGSQKPVSGTIELYSHPASHPMIFNLSESREIPSFTGEPLTASFQSNISSTQEEETRQANELRLKEVERQQKEFGEKR